jgi:outer membrane protein
VAVIRARLLAPVALGLALGGCAAVDPMALAPPSSASPWDGGVGDAGVAGSLAHASDLAAPEPDRTYDLVGLIDLAQRSNPETRIAWEQARAAAARLGIAEAAYYPALVLLASGGYTRSEARSPIGPLYTRGWALTPQLRLEWMLLDFGRRSARTEAAMQTLVEANFHFNRRHQEVTFAVQRNFYSYDAARAQVEAVLATLKSAISVQQDAEARFARGLATRTEVLLAKQERARAEFDLQLARRRVADAWAALAESLGISPAARVEVLELAGLPLPGDLTESVEQAMDRALAQRPDVAALLARLRAREAEVREANADFWPRISLGGMVGLTTGDFLADTKAGQTGPFSYTEPIYGGLINFSWTLFDGFERKNHEREAEAQRGQAEATLTAMQIRTLREVWKAYADVKAARLQYDFAGALLAASQEAYDSASITYRAGLGTILDLLAAERELARGRSTVIESRAEVLTTTAALAFAIGDSGSPAPGAESGR